MYMYVLQGLLFAMVQSAEGRGSVVKEWCEQEGWRGNEGKLGTPQCHLRLSMCRCILLYIVHVHVHVKCVYTHKMCIYTLFMYMYRHTMYMST